MTPKKRTIGSIKKAMIAKQLKNDFNFLEDMYESEGKVLPFTSFNVKKWKKNPAKYEISGVDHFKSSSSSQIKRKLSIKHLKTLLTNLGGSPKSKTRKQLLASIRYYEQKIIKQGN